MFAKVATKPKTPKYRERVPYGQAIVTLTDAVTKKRKDYWLGEMHSPSSREMYHRVVSEWEASGRRLPAPTDVPKPALNTLAVNEIILKYKQFVEVNYKPGTKATIFMALRVLRQFFGSTSAIEFGPNRLRLVRDQMVKGDPKCDPPRKPWARETVNKAVHQVRAMFRWATSHELLPPDVYHQLRTVSALRRGRSEARETERVEPVAIEIVEATKPYLNRQVKALVDLQLLTGARGGELFRLRPIDLNRDAKNGVWTFQVRDHKNAHHDHDRVVYFGPKAQKIIRPFLVGRPLDSFLFSPAEAEATRRAKHTARRTTPPQAGNGIGTNRVASPKRQPGDHFTSATYRRSIERACAKASVPRWRPHQLRHASGTIIRREFGLEAARIVLGHSSAKITDAVYADRDMQRVAEIMRVVG